jgi:hypothetical protein
MVDQSFGWPSLRQRHVERGEHELRSKVIGHCPSDDLSTPHIEDDGQVQKADPRRDVRDVGDP